MADPPLGLLASALLERRVELQKNGLRSRHPDFGQSAVPDGGIPSPVLAERCPEKATQGQPDHGAVRYDEDAAIRVGFGDFFEAGHESSGGLGRVLAAREMIGHRVDLKGGVGRRESML